MNNKKNETETDDTSRPFDRAVDLACNMIVAYFYDHYIDTEDYLSLDDDAKIELENGPSFRPHISLADESLQKEISIISKRADLLLRTDINDPSTGFDLSEETIQAILTNFRSEDIPPGTAMTALAPHFPEKVMNIEVLNQFLTKCQGFHILRLWIRPPEGALYVLPSRIVLDVILPWLSKTGYIQTLLSTDVEYLADSNLGETLHFLSKHPSMTSADRELCKSIIEKYWNAISSSDAETRLNQRIRILGDASSSVATKRRTNMGSARREARKADIYKNRK